MPGCPLHPDEVREPRFAELDELIAAGWGSVPFRDIEAFKARNGGVLPMRAPDPDDPDVSEALSSIGDDLASGEITSLSEAVLRCVINGATTAPQIAGALGQPSRVVAARLSYLACMGKIQSTGYASGSDGARLITYAVADLNAEPTEPAECAPKQDLSAVVEAVKINQMTLIDGVVLALIAGYTCSAEIATAFGSSASIISSKLTKLTNRGKIRPVGTVRVGRGQIAVRYEAVQR
jgi:hypothetical protein